MISHTQSNSGVPLPPSLAPRSNRPESAAPGTAPETADRLDARQAESLRSALAEQPEIRPEVVEEASALAVDPRYPPLAIIEDLARLFVNSADLTDLE